MNNPFEPDMFGSWGKRAGDDPGLFVHTQVKVQAVPIVAAANDAPAGVGKLNGTHGHSCTGSAANVKV